MEHISTFDNILIVQTAFLGDVVLVTSLIECVRKEFPQAEISILVRDGAQDILQNNPHIKEILVWKKKKQKFLNLFRLIKVIRAKKYCLIINVQRYFSSGLLTTFSGAKIKVGFKTNPWSRFFSFSVDHSVPQLKDGKYLHEVQRNFLLLKAMRADIVLPDAKTIKPKLYFKNESNSLKESNYLVMAPSSVWFTKQWAAHKWIELLQAIPKDLSVFFVGSGADYDYCQDIITKSKRSLVTNACGKFSLNQTALLMKGAKRVFTNDSSPQHLASSVNAPQTVIFCSTLPEYGFGPLSDDSIVLEVKALSCRPCGIHGKKKCPKNHFQCSENISVLEVSKTLIQV